MQWKMVMFVHGLKRVLNHGKGKVAEAVMLAKLQTRVLTLLRNV